jgi:hypothetical protein
MSTPNTPQPPDLLVLEALLGTCRQVCRLNSSYEVRKAALDYEARLEKMKAQVVAKLAQSPTEEAA